MDLDDFFSPLRRKKPQARVAGMFARDGESGS
jgi:hypothetical protein